MHLPGITRLYGQVLRLLMEFNHFGNNVKICPFCEIRRGAAPYIYIGNNVSLGKDVWLNIPYEVPLGKRSKFVIRINDGVAIGRRCMITALNTVDIGINVLIGPGVFLGDHSHEFDNYNLSIIHQGVTEPGSIVIEEGCWLGYHSAVIANNNRDVRIGRNTVIGANAVVTKSCPPNSVLVGNPAVNLRKKND